MTQEKREATEPSFRCGHALDADKNFAETVDAAFCLTRRKVTLDGRWRGVGECTQCKPGKKRIIGVRASTV
jgi:hypothetical protein